MTKGKCDICDKQLVYNQHVDGVCGDCYDTLRPEPETTHKPICSEYWERGLNCPCIPAGTTESDCSDPSWGQYD